MKKNKKLIIICAISIILIIGGVQAYISLGNKAPINENNPEIPTLTDEELCVKQFGNNATIGEPGFCACKNGYERNTDKTRCIAIKPDMAPIKYDENIEPKKVERKNNSNNTFYGIDDENNERLIPLQEGEKGQKFEENPYKMAAEPDRKLKEGEELIVDNHSKIKAIHNNDEDYLTDIIDGINTKKKFSENPQNKKAYNESKNNGRTTSTTETTKSQTLIENFIGSIEARQTNEGILYEYTFTDPSFGITPIRVGFVSNTRITNSDIITDIGGNGININKLKFHGSISNVEVTKDFGVSRCWPFEPEGYVFKPGTNTFSLKGQSEEGFTYINHFNAKLYPVFSFPRTELSEGNKYCVVEIGKKENFSKFPFELKGSFENAVVAVTKNKDIHSNCMQLLGNHDNIMVIYNEEIACEIWYNNGTSLREISTK